MVTFFLLLGSFPLVAQAQVSAQAVITSTYTSLDLDRCERIDDGAEPASATWRCEGYRGVPLIVQNGDDRYDIDAGVEDEDEFWAETFDYPGKTVEWRLAGGKPFAIIYRLTVANPDAPQGSRLIVETIGEGSPGCRVASIDGRSPRANALARDAADRVFGGKAVCMAGAVTLSDD
jgi:hypothetical protein